MIPTQFQIGVVVALAMAVGVVAYGQFKKSQGKQEYRETLLQERIITKDQVRGVDNEVFGADESGLCDLLGGCGLPDDSTND